MKLFNFLAKSHVSKALQIYPIYYYGRAVTKIMKKKSYFYIGNINLFLHIQS